MPRPASIILQIASKLFTCPLKRSFFPWASAAPSRSLSIAVLLSKTTRSESSRSDRLFVPGSYREGKHYVLDKYPGVTGGWWQHRPESKGYVHATSTDVFVDPIIQPNYLEHPLDQEVMVGGMKIIRELLHSPMLSKYLVEETIPGVKVQTDEQMLDFCRRNGSTGYHLVGTAKMGPKSDKMAVVDNELRVHGMQNLRVVDASVMPMIVSAHTYAATMMIAEKASDLIKAQR